MIYDVSYECPECRVVFAPGIDSFQADIGARGPEAPLYGRLRVVGAESGWFQLDLDRSNPSTSAEALKKSTYHELVRYNCEYAGRRGNPFPLGVLAEVADNYHIIQQKEIKRSTMKKLILAALVFHTCISAGLMRSAAEAAELLQLASHGISRGDTYLQSIHEDRGLEINMNCSRLAPHITTTFAQLDLFGEQYNPHRAAVIDIIETAKKNNIGYNSILRSKVIATTYEVLRRKGPSISLEKVALICKVRKHTLNRFLTELAEYHSYFKEVYSHHGLLSVA